MTVGQTLLARIVLNAVAVSCCWLAAAPLFAEDTEGAEGAPVPGQIADLHWMAGSWVGQLGPQTIEETWLPAHSGTIAAVVRFTQGGATQIAELIVIEQAAESLVFRVRQFVSQMAPRDPPGQTLRLADIGERHVTFSGVGDSEFTRLTYSRPAVDRFVIDVELRAGGAFQLAMKPAADQVREQEVL